MRFHTAVTSIGLALVAAACTISSGGSRQPTRSPQTYGPQGQPAAYGGPQVSPTGATPPTPQIPGVVTGDPISALDIGWLRGRVGMLMKELIATLPDARRQRVSAIPLAIDDAPNEVNAFAGCIRGGAVLVVTDGLLDVAAFLARARANDDVFGTHKTDEYFAFVAKNQAPQHPVVNPPLGFFDPVQESDSRRVARQHDILDELLGFVVGHELGHHYLGHLPCTGAPGPFGMGEVARGISSAVPLFNQPNELAADAAGTGNLLVMGGARQGYHLTEGGALLLMQFFSALDQLSPIDVLFGFERTHPPPGLRIPVIQQAAAYYRTTATAIPVFGF